MFKLPYNSEEYDDFSKLERTKTHQEIRAFIHSWIGASTMYLGLEADFDSLKVAGLGLTVVGIGQYLMSGDTRYQQDLIIDEGIREIELFANEQPHSLE